MSLCLLKHGEPRDFHVQFPRIIRMNAARHAAPTTSMTCRTAAAHSTGHQIRNRILVQPGFLSWEWVRSKLTSSQRFLDSLPPCNLILAFKLLLSSHTSKTYSYLPRDGVVTNRPTCRPHAITKRKTPTGRHE